MCRRLISLVFLALVLGAAGGAGADNVDWTNAQPNNNSWCNLYNWDPEGIPSVPPPRDVVFVSQVVEGDAGDHQGISPDRGPVIGTGCAALAASIYGPDPEFGHTQVMDINGTGTLDITGDWMWRPGIGEAIVNISDSAVVDVGGMWRGTDNGISIINIDGNPTITVTGVLRGGDEAGSFYLNMSGGYLEIGQDSDDEFAIGDNGGGEINVSGGKIICHGEMDMGGLRGSAEITVNMTAPGGLIRVESPFRFPGSASRAGSVFMNLDAGAIDCNEFHHGGSDDAPWTDDWLVDIEGGELRIWGDVRAAIDANVAAGQITAYDGEGEVLVQLIDGNTVVTGIPPDPNTASDPYPPHRSRLIDPNVVCNWTPGMSATSHDVYFGTDHDDVETATTSDPVYQGNVAPNSWDPCSGGDLAELTTYYWRIDEKNGGTFKGRIWHFTTKGPVIDPNMRVWYKLDEPNGYAAYDSSGYGHDGAVDGNELLWDPDGGEHDGCRAFNFSGDDAETVIDVPPTVLDTMGSGVTIIVWLKDNFDNTGNWVFGTGVGGEDGPYHVQASAPNDTGTVFFRAGNDTNDVLEADLAKRLEWHHYAFVKDESKDEMCIYFEGKLLGKKTGVDNTLSNVIGAAFKLGSVTWSSNYEYEGRMDDFKVFDYGLSALEVAADFRGGDLAMPWSPDPGNFEEDVPRDANLAWTPGDYAVQHRVYFGTDWDDVNDADTSSAGIYKGQQDPNKYDLPGYLELDTTYYWRIDEVNDNDPCVWKGPIWQFTVANYLIIDNFESYDDDNRIYYTWEDGVVNLTGSYIDLGVEPFSPAHTGDQSMEYVYDNIFNWGVGYYSEAELPFDSPQDFTEVGIKALTLYFYGDPGNDIDDTEQLYVGLGGSYAQVNYPDMNAVKKSEWTEWNIEIKDFNSPEVIDPCAVTSLYIGFGDRNNDSTPGGDGIAYFDNIRLYPPRCIPSVIKPYADLSNNCIVDWADVKIMALQWLRTDAQLATSNPGTANLVGHWQLDEGMGKTANDTSVYANHGAIQGSYEWVAGKVGPYAVEFTNGRVLVPDAPQLKPPAQVSAAAWINYTEDQDTSPRIIVKGKDNYEAYAIEVADDDYHITFYVGDVNGERYFADSPEHAVFPDEWFHLAGTYDGTIVKSYINGQQVGDNNEANSIPLSQDPNGLGIGNRSDANNRPFVGTIDDARVYNRALTAAEVAYLATGGSGYVPLTSAANFYDTEPVLQKAINIRDIAILLDAWQEQKLWP